MIGEVLMGSPAPAFLCRMSHRSMMKKARHRSTAPCIVLGESRMPLRLRSFWEFRRHILTRAVSARERSVFSFCKWIDYPRRPEPSHKSMALTYCGTSPHPAAVHLTSQQADEATSSLLLSTARRFPKHSDSICHPKAQLCCSSQLVLRASQRAAFDTDVLGCGPREHGLETEDN